MMTRQSTAQRALMATLGVNQRATANTSSDHVHQGAKYGTVRRCVAAILGIDLRKTPHATHPKVKTDPLFATIFRRAASITIVQRLVNSGGLREMVARNVIAVSSGIFLTVFLGLTATIGITSSSSPSPELGETGARKSDYKWVEDIDGFSLYVPRSFQRDPHSEDFTYTSEPRTQKLEVRVTAVNGYTPWEEAKSDNGVASMEPGYKAIRLEKLGKAATAPTELEYYHDSSTGIAWRTAVRVLIGTDGKMYSVLMTAPRESWEDSYRNFSVAAWSLCTSGDKCVKS